MVAPLAGSSDAPSLVTTLAALAAPAGNGTHPKTGGRGICIDLVSPHTPRGVLFNNLVIALPSACFLAFLALRFRASTRRLRAARSHMMWAYFCACWAVSLLALLRAVLLTAYVESNFSSHSSASTAHADLLNALWLATRGGLTLLEVSVVVFLAQGYTLGGAAALARTGAVAGSAALLESAVEAALVFGKHHVPLFLWGGGAASGGASGDLSSAKWGFWLVRSLLFASLYALVLRVPRSARWRDLLPATPAFFRYCSVLCGVHGATLLGSLLLLSVGGRWALSWPGYCLVGVAGGVYYGLFPAALYSAFLAAFFADSALDLDLAYYSEMRDAGYFEGGGGIGGFGGGGGSESSLLGGGGGGGGEVGF